LAGGIHHVTARGNNRERIFCVDADRRRYLGLLAAEIARRRWLCLAYCLMDNHVHLLLETPEPNLGAGMQQLHGLYGQTFNRRHRRVGHVFQGRFHAEPVRRDAHLWIIAGYIAGNPVEAGLCDQPESWPWSSHAVVAAGRAPRWLAHGRLEAYLDAMGGTSDGYRSAVGARLASLAHAQPTAAARPTAAGQPPTTAALAVAA
jgi:REP element-mobilizing transposase RayT